MPVAWWRAAERPRIRRTTLVEKMRKYGMSRRDEEGARRGLIGSSRLAQLSRSFDASLGLIF